jgi:prepilin-type N-terminal cleavage/methylation domain-containing protein
MDNSKKGFTLIELLIVVAILGILSAAVITAINPAKRISQARDAQVKMNLGQLKSALESYYVMHGSYPTTKPIGEFDGWRGECDMPVAWGTGNFPRTGPNAYIPNFAPDEIKILPTDPRNRYGICYFYATTGNEYKLMAHGLPENYTVGDPFIDPNRPTWAYAIWSSDVPKYW